MLSRRTSSKCCGVSLVAIGVVVNTALYLNIVWRFSSNVSNLSNVHNVSTHAHAHANMVEDFYSGVTSDIKGWKYIPSDREADIQKEIEVRLQAASDKKVWNTNFPFKLKLAVKICRPTLYAICHLPWAIIFIRPLENPAGYGVGIESMWHTYGIHTRYIRELLILWHVPYFVKKICSSATA